MTASAWHERALGEVYARRREPGIEGLPIYAVTMQGLRERSSTDRRVESALGAAQHALVRQGDLVYNTMRMWQGVSGVAPCDCLISPAYVVCRPSGEIWPRFAAHAFQTPEMIQRFKAFSEGVASDRFRLYYHHFARIHLCLPPRREQQRITEILDTVDEAIKIGEQIIAKREQTRLGLLRDLLAHGIDDVGVVRDPRKSPRDFVVSPVGFIPKPWLLRTLGEVADWRSGGTPSKSNATFWNGTIPWVTPKDMKTLRLQKTQDYVTSQAVSSGSQLVPAGSVLVVVRGMILARTFPACLVETEVSFNQDIKAAVPSRAVDGAFLAYWFTGNTDRMLRLVTESTHGTKKIDMTILLRSSLAIPGLKEQRRIVKVLQDADAEIESERAELAKFRALKSALMQDLLTGRVRVKVPSEASP